ncbi:MAG: glycerol-3-phosphate 1-O-acyltransferase PlsY [Pseudomonadota bacterium]
MKGILLFIVFFLMVAAYLLGSVSSAILVCRCFRLPDPRTQGSHNPGATNVLRIGGKLPAAVTLVGDMAKGLIPMLICHLLDVAPLVFACVGLAAFLGHLYPVFFKFQGGKGVATAMGMDLGLHWLIGLSVIGLWLLVAKVMRVSSLAALISMTLAPLIVAWVWPAPEIIGLHLVVTLWLLVRHRSNIQKLIRGEEDKIRR